MLFSRCIFCGLLVLVALLSGCGDGRPTRIPVSGVMTLEDQPVAGASVMFSPVDGGRPAEGVTDDQGRFELKTFDPGDGAILGKHRVTVRKVEIQGVEVGEDGLAEEIRPGEFQEVWHTPKRYGSLDSTDLEVDVQYGMELPVRLTLKP